MTDADQKGFVHGGGRKHVGAYPTAEEAQRFKELCAYEGVTQSAQLVALIQAWVAIIEKQLESEKN